MIFGLGFPHFSSALPVISTGAHQDSGLLTILQVFGGPGLELELDGTWYRVEAKPDTLVVNLGEQMTDMSNGWLKATIHRVVDIGKERYVHGIPENVIFARSKECKTIEFLNW